MSVLKLKRGKLDPSAELLRDTVKVLLAVMREKDAITCAHSVRVADYALMIGRALNLTKQDLETLELGALLHDIGKIGIPDHILKKPGPLTRQEYEEMKAHPVKSGEIVSKIKILKDVVPGVKYHQENVDGSGYPEGLRGDDIPLHARIIYIADAFDAMTSNRPYRKAMTERDALSELEKGSGKQFDSKLVNVFIQSYGQYKKLQKSSRSSTLQMSKKAVGE